MREKHIHGNPLVLALDPDYLGCYLDSGKDGLSLKDKQSYRNSINGFSIPGSDVKFSYAWTSNPEEGAIALHPIQDIITFNSWWRFSTYDFMLELKAADENPSFVAHMLYIDSPGGDVFGLNEAHHIIRKLSKPVYALVESRCCSAAYYLASAANKIFVTSPLSTVGSIGCMATLCDFREYYEKQGIKDIDIYATKSIRKNKTYMDAIDGNVKDYILKVLDPAMALFESNVRSSRANVDDSVFEGDSYYSQEALRLGLIDGVGSFAEVANKLLVEVENRNISIQLSNLL